MPTDKDFEEAFTGEKVHPWRVCAKGYHLRGGTEQVIHVWKPKKGDTIPPLDWKLEKNIVKCVKNSTPKDCIHPDEMIGIAGNYFIKLSGPPRRKKLGLKRGNEFNWIIRGWTQYWNDVLKPKVMLDSNLVKALIAPESGFNPKSRSSLGAKGLLQIMESTRRILKNPKGELKDYLVIIPKDEIYDPIVNICGGIRWLFRKYEIVQSRKKGKASWRDAVFAYKAGQINPRVMDTFDKYYKELLK